MFKQALYTYWTSLHPRNLKYIPDKRPAMLILLLVLLPEFREISEYGVGAFYAASVFLPVALMKMSNLAGKLNIPKVLFMTPMQEEERKKYIKCLIAIKIGVSMLLGLIIQLAWYVSYSISAALIWISMFVYLSYGIAEYFCVEGALDDGVRIEHGIREADGQFSASFCNLGAITTVVLYFMGLVPLDREGEITPLWDLTIQEPALFIILVVMLIFDIIIVIRQYRDMLDSVCKFEVEMQAEK